MSADAPTPLDLDAITVTLAAECDLADRDMRKWVRYPVKHLRSLLAEVERLRAEVERLRAAHDLIRTLPYVGADLRETVEAFASMMDAAVVREHLPVKPDREAVARAIFEAGAAGAAVEFGLDGPVPWSSLDADDVERMCAQADAVLDLWPGRSDAEAKAEALNEAADWLAGMDDGRDTGQHRAGRDIIARLRDRADRLAAEGGADRG